MKQADKIHRQVADFYGKRISGNCCAPAIKGGTLVEYDAEALGNVAPELTESSFGCGNPLAFAAIPAGATVLDLGSGAGLDLLLAAERVGPAGKVIGVDMTDAMIERARANIARAGVGNIEVRKGQIEALPLPDSSVDWVISNCVINLSPQKDRVFSEIARVLKPGGQFSISDLVVRDLPWWARASSFLYSACVAGAIGEDEYLRGLQAAGLQQVSVSERSLYEPVQLVGLIEDMLPGALLAPRCCGKPLLRGATRRIAAAAATRVWSAKFVGRKSLAH